VVVAAVKFGGRWRAIASLAVEGLRPGDLKCGLSASQQLVNRSVYKKSSRVACTGKKFLIPLQNLYETRGIVFNGKDSGVRSQNEFCATGEAAQ